MSRNRESKKILSKNNNIYNWANIVDNSIVLMNSEGKVIWANDAFSRLYGYTLEEYKTKYSKVASEAIKNIHKTDTNFFKENHSLTYITESETKSGKIKWVQTTLTPTFNDYNKIKNFIAVETDITRLKEIEEELKQEKENSLALSEHIENVKDYIEEQKQEIFVQKQAIEESKQKTESVLNRVLPYEVAIQLKNKGYSKPRHYKRASVLFANFKNFSPYRNNFSTEDMINYLHQAFSSFDEIIEEHFVEKIKTNAGLYICAGGVPLRNKSNPIDVLLVSLKMKKIVENFNELYKKNDENIFEVSIGINTGEIIAGIVGKNKLSYDIWGDAVNIARQLEIKTNFNEINISASTHEYIKEYFDCEYNNNFPSENGNLIDMYLVKRIKPEFSFDNMGTVPNLIFNKTLSKI
ncbi:MAG: PAS domain S-box protein [Bacteroidales bacterium]|nr:PAS domain S-box protein [Bacteroidales bacterium]